MYATQTDMENRFSADELISLTDRARLGSFDADVFAQAQLDGDAEIDGYLRPRYALPLAEVPDNLVRMACDLYRYYLCGDIVPEHVQKRYDQAVATLKLIMTGKMDIAPTSAAEPAPEPMIKTAAGTTAVFTDSKLKGFI